MAYWRFTEYLTEEPRCPIIEWYGLLDADVQAALDLLVKILSETEDWDEASSNRRKYKELSRHHVGLCELRFKVGRRRFRPLGIIDKENRTFMFLCGCEKFGRGATDPEGAFEIALRLKEQFEAGRGVEREYTF
jgi:hypothetical protein